MEYVEYLPFIIAVVEALKLFGINGRWSALAAILLGVGLSFGLDFVPEAMAHLVRALMLGLAAAGFYRIGKRAGSAALEALSS